MISCFRLKNISSFLNVQKHVLRELIKTLEPFSKRKMKERSAAEFSISDLYFFKIVLELNKNIGIKIEIISSFSNNLYNFIKNIKSLDSESTLWIFQEEGMKWKFSQEPKLGGVCFSIPLGKMLMEVNSSLGMIGLRNHSLIPFSPKRKKSP